MRLTYLLGTFFLLLVILAIVHASKKSESLQNYYSFQVRRMPCGRILQREVVEQDGAWQKRVRFLDPEGRVLDEKVRTIEPEQCQAIQAGRFVPRLWADCAVAL